MKKIGVVIAALALAVAMGTATLAAEAPVVRGCGYGHRHTDGSRGAVCAYVDADGDGVCDNCRRAFVDADGDGVCDNHLRQCVRDGSCGGARRSGGRGRCGR